MPPGTDVTRNAELTKAIGGGCLRIRAAQDLNDGNASSQNELTYSSYPRIKTTTGRRAYTI